MLEFIYCGRIALTDDLAISLLKAGNKYLVTNLKMKCEEHLIKSLAIENVLDRVELAEQTNAIVLREGTLNYLTTNSRMVTRDIDIKRLSKDYLVDLMFKGMFTDTCRSDSYSKVLSKSHA